MQTVQINRDDAKCCAKKRDAAGAPKKPLHVFREFTGLRCEGIHAIVLRKGEKAGLHVLEVEHVLNQFS
jgi:hypothetical protein